MATEFLQYKAVNLVPISQPGGPGFSVGVISPELQENLWKGEYYVEGQWGGKAGGG